MGQRVWNCDLLSANHQSRVIATHVPVGAVAPVGVPVPVNVPVPVFTPGPVANVVVGTGQ